MDCVVSHPYGSGQLGGDSAEPLRPGGLQLTREMIARAGFAAGQQIIDLGCGCGASTELLAARGCRVVGVDLERATLIEARRRHPASHWVAASATALPFARASQNGILAECSLSLVPERARALAECRRVLRAGAILALCDVYARQVGADSPANGSLPACVARMTDQESWRASIQDAGFRLDAWEDRSQVLKVFIARLIFEQGGAESLWAPQLDQQQARAHTQALTTRRPGYFLLLARAI